MVLNLQHIISMPPAPKPKPKSIPQPIKKPMIKTKPLPRKKVKPTPETEEIKRTLLDQSHKIVATKSTTENNVSKEVKKPVKKVVKQKSKKHTPKKTVSKKIVQKKTIKKSTVKRKHIVKKRKTKRSHNSFANMLMGTGTALHPSRSTRSSSSGSYSERMIKRLYGKSFDTFSPTQKKYIRNNLSTIHQITQRTLSRNGYPTVAIQTNQQGTNVVSFYLHPNGDISGLHLKKRIGYTALDKNTIKVIKLAYKDYPLPNQKTKIIFYVQYSMY